MDKIKCTFYARKRTLETQGNSKGVLSTSNYREPNVMDSFYCRVHEHPDGSKSHRYVDDVYMLLNQKRLDRMTSQAFTEYITQYSAKSDSLASLRKKCTDKQLQQYCKSRYLQHPSELLSWSRYLDSQGQSLADEIAAMTGENAEPEPSPTPAAE